MSKPDAQAWTYSELDRLYPPPETERTAGSDYHLGSAVGGNVTGLSDIPASWGELPANASLQAEVSWVQANRLRCVRETSDCVVVDLSRALYQLLLMLLLDGLKRASKRTPSSLTWQQRLLLSRMESRLTSAARFSRSRRFASSWRRCCSVYPVFSLVDSVTSCHKLADRHSGQVPVAFRLPCVFRRAL